MRGSTMSENQPNKINPNEHMCPLRAGDFMSGRFPGPDRWDKRGNDRVCSYCGSMHPDEFLECVKKAADGVDGVELDVADRRHKIYIHRPGITNADGGAIKFYIAHFSDEQFKDNFDLLNTAISRSFQRLIDRHNKTIQGKIKKVKDDE